LTFQTLVTPGSELRPLSAKAGEGMPHRAIVNAPGFGPDGGKAGLQNSRRLQGWRPGFRAEQICGVAGRLDQPIGDATAPWRAFAAFEAFAHEGAGRVLVLEIIAHGAAGSANPAESHARVPAAKEIPIDPHTPKPEPVEIRRMRLEQDRQLFHGLALALARPLPFARV
jgi:hypothetical protein